MCKSPFDGMGVGGAAQIPEENLHLHGRMENTVNAKYENKPFPHMI